MARLPGAAGLVARLPRGLFPRLSVSDLGFGTFGDVARLATMECPPRPGAAAGEVAREPLLLVLLLLDALPGRGTLEEEGLGVWERDSTCCGWGWMAGSGGAVGGSSSSSSTW